MVVVFDMDNTLTDEFGRARRPGMNDLLAQLKKEGCTLVLWTSSTRNRAKRILRDHGLRDPFSQFVFREDYDPENAGLHKDIRKVEGAFLVDDDPKQIDFVRSIKKQGFLITSFRSDKPVDRAEIDTLHRAIKSARRKEKVLNLFR